jgi:hypothetical protein
MAALNSRKTLKNLIKKGFKDAEHKSDDHKRLEFWHEGKITPINTRFSHNSQDIDDYLISRMSKQLRLSKDKFKQFAECSLSELDYINLLKSQGDILN